MFAQWARFKGRQQSWLQQDAGAENVELWLAASCSGLRMQQACGAGAAIARATGANVPTSSRINKNLAVKRCIEPLAPHKRVREA